MSEEQQTGKRARNRADVESLLLRTARGHLASKGAAALSLRAIARDMRMAPSALFRYTANREELLTLLIETAFTELADRVAAAEGARSRDDLTGRWSALARTFRAWALENPHDYALLYGSPVPDYSAPPERTSEPGTRVMRILAGIAQDASTSGQTAAVDHIDPHGAGRGVSDLMQDPDLADLDPRRVVNLLAVWNLLVGTVTSEVFGHLGPDVGDGDQLFECHVVIGGQLLFGA